MSRGVAFAGWLAVGAAYSLAFVSMLTIGAYVAIAATVLLVIVLKLVGARSIAGFISGLGLVPLWVAWTNRAGPGEVCTQTATAIQCTELYDPWPWALVGGGLAVTGLAAFAWTQRSQVPPAPMPTA